MFSIKFEIEGACLGNKRFYGTKHYKNTLEVVDIWIKKCLTMMTLILLIWWPGVNMSNLWGLWWTGWWWWGGDERGGQVGQWEKEGWGEGREGVP